MKRLKRKKKTARKPFYSVLGGLIRMRRTTLGLTQRELCKKLRHSEPSALSGYETGRVVVPVKALTKLAHSLAVNLHQLCDAHDLDEVRRKEAASWHALNKKQGLA